jgi:hypothetical protein
MGKRISIAAIVAVAITEDGEKPSETGEPVGPAIPGL